MSKVLVLYYSSYGHVEALAGAIAEGARSAGATVDIKRVPETAPMEMAKAAHFKLDQKAPVAAIAELADYDAIVVRTPTRFGRISSQMAAFLDQAGGLWMSGALNGKVGGAFTSSATQHGGQEATLFSIVANLLHFGMTIVGLPYSHQGQMTLDEIVGGSPYGATTISLAARVSASRAPSNSLARATRASWSPRSRTSCSGNGGRHPSCDVTTRPVDSGQANGQRRNECTPVGASATAVWPT
jgi:NAD(P)H dehydrogenase (quinone)